MHEAPPCQALGDRHTAGRHAATPRYLSSRRSEGRTVGTGTTRTAWEVGQRIHVCSSSAWAT